NFYFVMTDRFDNGTPGNDACIATGHAPEGGELPVDCAGTDKLVAGVAAHYIYLGVRLLGWA
ncbi:MAG TPA: hypothetical protein PLW80_09790, partial [Spirochaetales bacterium]|nr:hypothetical protein [Spirochaetales bacterium]